MRVSTYQLKESGGLIVRLHEVSGWKFWKGDGQQKIHCYSKLREKLRRKARRPQTLYTVVEVS